MNCGVLIWIIFVLFFFLEILQNWHCKESLGNDSHRGVYLLDIKLVIKHMASCPFRKAISLCIEISRDLVDAGVYLLDVKFVIIVLF